jgi:hypothetical protein
MTRQRDYRWLLVVQLYLVTALWGAVQVDGDNTKFQLLTNAFQASAVSLWVVLDARANGRSQVRIVQELHVFFWLFAAPIYLMRTRGFRRGFSLSVAHAIGILIVNHAAFYSMLYVQYGADAFAQPRF